MRWHKPRIEIDIALVLEGGCRPAVVSKELKARIEALRSEGTLTARQIGERLGVSRRTIYRALTA